MLGLVLAIMPHAFAQEAAPAPAPAPAPEAAAPAETTPVKVVDPKVTELLDKLGTFYAGLKGFSVDATETDEFPEGETKKQTKTTYQISFARPAQIKSSWDSDGQQVQVVSDGTTLYIYMPAEKEYRKIEAPKDAMRVMHGATSGPGHLGGQLFAHFVSEKPFANWLEGFPTIGFTEIDDNGAKLSVLAFSDESEQGAEKVEIFVKQGEQPLVSRMKVSVKRSTGEEMGLTVDLNWKLNPEFAETEFKFQPPEGAKEAEPPKQQEESGEESAAEKMKGQPAPECTLTLVDGTEVKLADLKNKNVVILDLWATWCGPCRKALPVITKVAESYKEKGVLLYAVNLGDSKDEIAKFLETSKINPTVAFDPEGKVGELFKVKGIPQTVIIGKDGIIKSVKVGAGDDIENEIKKEIEAALGAAPAAEPAK